jgi:hypothetical protein
VVGDRRLLLADEPSGALDSVNADEVMRPGHAPPSPWPWSSVSPEAAISSSETRL